MIIDNPKSKMNAPVLRRLRKSSNVAGNVPTFRIVVFGQSGVGKTAMSVRFVTKRFIGEYDPTLENIYQHYYGIGGSSVLFEIMDTAGQEENDLMMAEKIRWADAFLLVYAINDQTSFDEIPRLKFTITHTMAQLGKQAQPDPVITIVGNKMDLEPDRMVDRAEGESVARSMNCDFQEISVRDGLNDVIDVFEDTYAAYKSRIAVFNSLNESSGSGSLTRRKTKSFKYVDRIPRMQGRRRAHATFVDSSVRNHVISDVMTSKIDEDMEMTERNGATGVRSNGRYMHWSTSSLPTDVTAGLNDVRPPQGRSRRNAVVGMPSLVNKRATGDSERNVSPSRYKLVTHRSANSLPVQYRDLHGRTVPQCDNNNNNNNNNNVPRANRRCRSQENIDLGSHGLLENFTKRAVTFEVSNGLSKRVS